MPVLCGTCVVSITMKQDVLTELLGLTFPAVAIAFTDTPPAGVSPVVRSGPASCDYWRRATDGSTFYTVADEHNPTPPSPPPISNSQFANGDWPIGAWRLALGGWRLAVGGWRLANAEVRSRRLFQSAIENRESAIQRREVWLCLASRSLN